MGMLSEKELNHLRKDPGGRGPGDICRLLDYIDKLIEDNEKLKKRILGREATETKKLYAWGGLCGL